MTTPGPGPTSPSAPGPTPPAGYDGATRATGAPGYGTPGHGMPPAGYGGTPGYGAAPGYGTPPSYGGPPGSPGPVPVPGPAPAPGWAGPGGHVPPWSPAAAPPTDSLAVASLAVSCAGFLTSGLTGPVGLGLGIAALRRVRRTGAQGRGLALAGIWVGAAMTAVLLVLALFVALAVTGVLDTTNDATTGSSESSGPLTSDDDDGTWADETAMPWFELTDVYVPGDCFATAPETYDMTDATLVDCAAAHASEVVDRLAMSTPVLEDLSMPDAEYTELLDRCEAAVGFLVDPAALPEESYADVYYPHPSQWDAGGRTAYCVLTTSPSGTGSASAGTFAAGTGPSV